MKKKHYHRKLIRDNIPEVIVKSGGEYQIKILRNGDFEKELKRKLVEESKELQNTPKGKIVDELADVFQLLKSIAQHYKVKFSKVEKSQQEKKKKRGGFKKRLFLIWSSQPAGK